MSGRKSKLYTVPPHDPPKRDDGKTFLITEMSAVQAEKWAARALLALTRSGVDIPDEALQAGAAAVIASGLRSFAGIAFTDAEPLLDEMMQCVQRVPDASRPTIVRPLIDDDIDELTTRLLLRAEVIEIHTGFSVAGALSNLGASAKQTSGNTRRTPTSRKRSVRL